MGAKHSAELFIHQVNWLKMDDDVLWQSAWTLEETR